MQIKPYLLAEIALEVARFTPDNNKSQSTRPKAEWRWSVVDKAMEIISECGIDGDSEDLDEIVHNYFVCRRGVLVNNG